ncbi:jg18852 [Pararge aegeria aegeria]|uniref:Jg18852 protein n=1 Tax=Pararge aegeria aegeria TaxID=348720 RepID=A0A8S4QZ93_9NEOP|nr:jg18852 [Pararge aegeria aegeria]
MSQSIGVKEKDLNRLVCEIFFRRLTKISQSFLSGANKVRAYNGWVMPVLMYTFVVLRWTQTELDALDRKVRTTMTLHRMHHPMHLEVIECDKGLTPLSLASTEWQKPFVLSTSDRATVWKA